MLSAQPLQRADRRPRRAGPRRVVVHIVVFALLGALAAALVGVTLWLVLAKPNWGPA